MSVYITKKQGRTYCYDINMNITTDLTKTVLKECHDDNPVMDSFYIRTDIGKLPKVDTFNKNNTLINPTFIKVSKNSYDLYKLYLKDKTEGRYKLAEIQLKKEGRI